MVKESLVGVAQMKRAAGRKKGRSEADDTEMPEDIDRFENEGLEVEEEDGIKFMPFNLKEERETGHFDEHGNFVESKQKKADHDAWLDSTEVCGWGWEAGRVWQEKCGGREERFMS